jgi:phosphoglycolate phosphatase
MTVVLFDFDGTLVDSLDVMITTYNGIAPRYRLKPIEREDLPRLRTLGARTAMREHGMTTWKMPWVMRSMRRALREHVETLQPFDGIPEVLRALRERGVQLGILSSNSTRNIQRFLDRQGLQMFAHVDGGASMLGKARHLRKLLTRARLDPRDVLYVGDEVRDIEAAHAAGLRSVAVSWGYASREALLRRSPTHVVDQPTDLVDVITAPRVA